MECRIAGACIRNTNVQVMSMHIHICVNLVPFESSVYLMLIGNLGDSISKLLAIASSNHINPLKHERKTCLKHELLFDRDTKVI